MGVLAWVFAPWFAGQLSGPSAFTRSMIIALTIGLGWQFVLVMLLVRREQGTLRWSVLREVLWLRAPTSPRTGRRGGRPWLIVVPLIALAAAKDSIPKLPHAENLDFFTFIGTVGGREFLSGAWDWFAVLIVMCIFNTVIGGELLFRGYLLPRMAGVRPLRLGRQRCDLRGVRPAPVVGDPRCAGRHTRLCLAREALPQPLISMAVHSAQSVVMIALVLQLVVHV